MNTNITASPPQALLSDDANEARAVIYAGFWRRVGAHCLDLMILLMLGGLIAWFEGVFRLFRLYYFVPGLLFSLYYHVWLVRRYGGTPGKLIMKIRVARLDGSAVGYREAILRHSVVLVLSQLMAIALIIATLRISDADYLPLSFLERSAVLFALAPDWFTPVHRLLGLWGWSEFIVMLLNKRRRALHDFMAGTIVVRA
jgi:uncharacterized RDD family membrane protein YckC